MAIPKAPFLLLVYVAAAAAVLSGCSAESGMLRTPGGPPRGLHILVRDASTLRPIEGAAVVADTIARDHPFSVATVLSQTGPESFRTKTDSRGAAVVEVLDDRQFRLVVWASGLPPVVFGPLSLQSSAGQWIDSETPAGSASSPLQVRLCGDATRADR